MDGIRKTTSVAFLDLNAEELSRNASTLVGRMMGRQPEPPASSSQGQLVS